MSKNYKKISLVVNLANFELLFSLVYKLQKSSWKTSTIFLIKIKFTIIIHNNYNTNNTIFKYDNILTRMCDNESKEDAHWNYKNINLYNKI